MSVLLPIVIAVCGIALVPPVGAQTRMPPVGIRPIRLVLSPPKVAGEPVLSSDRLRIDLEAELRRPVRIGNAASPDADLVTITYRPARQKLTVGYLPQTGASVVRTLSVEGTVEEVASVAVLLAGNLARDQAGELLSEATGPAAERPAELARAAPAPGRSSSTPESSTSISTPMLAESRTTRRLDSIRIKPAFWTSSLSLMNVGLSVSDRRAYALLSASGHVERGRTMAGGGLAVGARIPLRVVWCESDVGITYLRGLDAVFSPPAPPVEGYYTNDRLVTRIRSALVFSVFKDVNLFAGLAFSWTLHLTAATSGELGPELFGGVQL